MKVSLERKVLIGALGLGALAFVLDRTVFSAGGDAAEPTSAADASAYVVKPSAGPQALPKVILGNETRMSSLAGRLRASSSARLGALEFRDAFMPSPAWQTAAVLEEPTARSTAQFAARHHLNGVLASGERSNNSGGHALVDGKIIAVGQLVDGFRLVSVSHRSATFESSDGRVVLEMDHNAAPPVAAANP